MKDHTRIARDATMKLRETVFCMEPKEVSPNAITAV